MALIVFGRSTRLRVLRALAVSVVIALGSWPLVARDRQQQAASQAPKGCRVTGTVTMMTQARGGQTTAPLPLPGATIVVHQGARFVVATATDIQGKFTIVFTPSQTFKVSAELMGFQTAGRDITLGALPCDTTLDFVLTLVPRDQPLLNLAATPAPGAAAAPAQAAPATAAAARPAQAGNAPAGRGAPAGAAAPGATTPATTQEAGRFTQLMVQADANGAAALETIQPETSADLSRLLPPGFSLQGANADAITINGNAEALSVDRGMMNDRMAAIGRGEFDPATGQFAAGFGPGGGMGGDNPFGQAGMGVRGGDGIGGGRGEGGGMGGGRGGGPGGFMLGGRAGRGQSLYQGSFNVNYGGSALDATAVQPINGVITPQPQLPFNRINVGATIGGPLKIPGIYADTNRRTNFQVNYTGNHSTTLNQAFTTVPTDAQRGGDFSSSPIVLVDPQTNQPFAGNQVPTGRMNPAALALLNYIPRANVPGVTVNNFQNSGTTLSTSNAISVRLTQNLSPTVMTAANGRGGAGRGGGGGGRAGAGGRGAPGGGRAGRPLSINLSVQAQYRENQADSFSVIPQFQGQSRNTSLTLPISLNVSKGRTTSMFNVNVAHTSSSSSNPFTNLTDAAGLAGIQYPAGDSISMLPLNWGVPNLTFLNFNLRLGAASVRRDTRVTTSYTFARPIKSHQVRLGFDYRHDASLTESNSNARGAFTYTGLYTTNGAQVARTSGADFADFLLGMPQQATLQAGGTTRLRENAFDVYVDDNWQMSPKLTFALGLRWEVTMPYTEANGQMANLDVAPNFTAAQVVCPAGIAGVCGPNGTLSGTVFPAGLLHTDWNNVGPRIGVAYRLAPKTVLRGSYSITYNLGSYASIARQMVGQPPFAFAETNAGTLADPLATETALLGVAGVTTNNFGVDPDYQLGKIHIWNATLSRELPRNWMLIVGYTGTKGTDLDLLRAPNRNADGTLRIPGVQAFTWESSGGHSILHLGNVQLRRRLAHGLSGGVNYTLSRSMDNASSLGAGGAVVAQNDQDLAAEWALSNFNQTHNFSADLMWELPFGLNRKWFTNGGILGGVLGEWSMTAGFSAHSGSPFTPRVVGATSSVATGTSGSLRANLVPGATIQLADPALLQFFNTAAFTPPPLGTFGTSPRNVIVGPAGHVMNMSFNRDMRVGGNRAITLQVNINNLLNTIQWTAINTNYNSNTFGQVTRFAGMRTVTANARFRF